MTVTGSRFAWLLPLMLISTPAAARRATCRPDDVACLSTMPRWVREPAAALLEEKGRNRRIGGYALLGLALAAAGGSAACLGYHFTHLPPKGSENYQVLLAGGAFLGSAAIAMGILSPILIHVGNKKIAAANTLRGNRPLQLRLAPSGLGLGLSGSF